jgi:hypothetical protein
MEEEGAVADLVDGYAGDVGHGGDERLGVGGVGGGAGDVDAEPAAVTGCHVKGGDYAAGVLDGAGDLADRAAVRGDFEPDGDGVGDTRRHGHRPRVRGWRCTA